MRFLGISIVVIIILGSLIGFSAKDTEAGGDDEVKLFLTPSATSMRVGDTIRVDMRIASGKAGIDGIDAVWQFDPTIFQATSATVTVGDCPLPTAIYNKIDVVKGVVTFSRGRTIVAETPPVQANCTLGSVKLTTKKVASNSSLVWILPPTPTGMSTKVAAPEGTRLFK